jgi:hypothetical protein
VITSESFEYSGRAKTNLIMLTLSQADIGSVAEESDALMQVMEKAAEFITENMAPACDYSPIFNYGEEDPYVLKDVPLSLRQRFRRAVRRVVYLNYRKQEVATEVYRVLDEIESMKMQDQLFTMQQ